MSVPKRPYQMWDGEVKLFTSDCPVCQYYRIIEQDRLCGWGEAFKYLVKPEKLMHCRILKSSPPAKSSSEYLDTIIEQGRNSAV